MGTTGRFGGGGHSFSGPKHIWYDTDYSELYKGLAVVIGFFLFLVLLLLIFILISYLRKWFRLKKRGSSSSSNGNINDSGTSTSGRKGAHNKSDATNNVMIGSSNNGHHSMAPPPHVHHMQNQHSLAMIEPGLPGSKYTSNVVSSHQQQLHQKRLSKSSAPGTPQQLNDQFVPPPPPPAKTGSHHHYSQYAEYPPVSVQQPVSILKSTPPTSGRLSTGRASLATISMR